MKSMQLICIFSASYLKQRFTTGLLFLTSFNLVFNDAINKKIAFFRCSNQYFLLDNYPDLMSLSCTFECNSKISGLGELIMNMNRMNFLETIAFYT